MTQWMAATGHSSLDFFYIAAQPAAEEQKRRTEEGEDVDDVGNFTGC